MVLSQLNQHCLKGKAGSVLVLTSSHRKPKGAQCGLFRNLQIPLGLGTFLLEDPSCTYKNEHMLKISCSLFNEELKRCCDHFKRENIWNRSIYPSVILKHLMWMGQNWLILGEWGVGRGISIKPLPNGAEFVWISVTHKLQDCRVAQGTMTSKNQIISAGLYSFLLKYTCFSTSSRVADTQMPLFYFIFIFYFKGGKSSSRRDQVKVKE